MNKTKIGIFLSLMLVLGFALLVKNKKSKQQTCMLNEDAGQQRKQLSG